MEYYEQHRLDGSGMSAVRFSFSSQVVMQCNFTVKINVNILVNEIFEAREMRAVSRP